MTKPTALRLAMNMVRDAYVVDVSKAPDKMLFVATTMDSPAPLLPGRYVMLEVKEAELLVKQIMAGESALMLAAAVKRTALQRRPKK